MVKIVFHELVIFYENGQALYFHDLIKNEVLDIEKKLEQDRAFKNRMYNIFLKKQVNVWNLF